MRCSQPCSFVCAMRCAILGSILRVGLAGLVGLVAHAALPSKAHATVEVTSDLSMSREFAWLTTDVRVDLHEGLVGLGAGAAMVSNLHGGRVGARLLAQLAGKHLTVGALGSWAPAQEGRGWLGVEPRASYRVELERVDIEGEVSVNLRRADAATRSGPLSIAQLQVQGELTLSIDDKWHLVILGARSLYDAVLSAKALRGADLGLLVSFAGHPESWALGGRAGVMLGPSWRLDVGLQGVVFADVEGSALVPRVALRTGPWRGFSVEVALDVAVGLGGAKSEPVRPIGGLALSYEK